MNEQEILVKAVLLADDPSTFVTRKISSFQLDLGGIPTDRHYGLLRPADSRQKIYPRGTPIANRRQISIVSEEECRRIAENMGLPTIKPEWLGANILISGFDPLTSLLPQGARLIFPDGTGLICEGENAPCIGPDRVIRGINNEVKMKKNFVQAAKKLRGIICSVEREGLICDGDLIRIII